MFVLDGKKMNTKYFVIVAAIAAVLVGATATVIADSAFAGEKREYSQASPSQANACGNYEMPINVGCQSTNSQIQGEENAIGITAQQTFSEVDNGNDRGHDRGHDRGNWGN